MTAKRTLQWWDPGVSPEPPNSQIWEDTPAPATLTKDQRDRQMYRAAAEIAERIKEIPGWRIQRGGVGITVWVGPDRQRCRPPDYMVWVENWVDRHLTGAPSPSNALDKIAEVLNGTGWDADAAEQIAAIVRRTGRPVGREGSE